MKLRFTKMHGAGNDFVVLDAVRQDIQLTAELARRLADRRFGVGADQVLVVGPPLGPGTDFSYRIFNQDGGEVEQCGNGARAFVRFVHDKGLTDKRAIRVTTAAGVIVPELLDDGRIRVDMGPPAFEPSRLPFMAEGLARQVKAAETLYLMTIGGKDVSIGVVSMGNPHAVIEVTDVRLADVRGLGRLVEHDERFPNRVNVGFFERRSPNEMALRVWERGAGETLACGTGACAAAVSAIRRGEMSSPVTIQTHGGTLTVQWDGDGKPVFLSGDAVTVYDGEIDLDTLLAGSSRSEGAYFSHGDAA